MAPNDVCDSLIFWNVILRQTVVNEYIQYLTGAAIQRWPTMLNADGTFSDYAKQHPYDLRANVAPWSFEITNYLPGDTADYNLQTKAMSGRFLAPAWNLSVSISTYTDTSKDEAGLVALEQQVMAYLNAVQPGIAPTSAQLYAQQQQQQQDIAAQQAAQDAQNKQFIGIAVKLITMFI